MSITQEELCLEKGDNAPWGFWQTLGLSIASIAIFYLIPALVMRMVAGNESGADGLYSRLLEKPLLLCVLMVLSSVVATFYTVFLSKLRPQVTLKEYFGLYKVGFFTSLLWVVCFLVVIGILSQLLRYTSYQAPKVLYTLFLYNNIPLLILAIVVLSPIYEELLFRGFMLKGIESTYGPVVAITLSSLLFALSHLQYDIYGMSLVFAMGLLLGYAKVKTKSIYTPMVMHASLNLLMIMAFKALMHTT